MQQIMPANAESRPDESAAGLQTEDRIQNVEEAVHNLRRLTLATHILWEQISPGSRCTPIQEIIEANIIQAQAMAKSICETLYGSTATGAA